MCYVFLSSFINLPWFLSREDGIYFSNNRHFESFNFFLHDYYSQKWKVKGITLGNKFIYLFNRFLQRNKFRQKKGKEGIRCLDSLSSNIPPSDAHVAPNVNQAAAKAFPRPHTTPSCSTHRSCWTVCMGDGSPVSKPDIPWLPRLGNPWWYTGTKS